MIRGEEPFSVAFGPTAVSISTVRSRFCEPERPDQQARGDSYSPMSSWFAKFYTNYGQKGWDWIGRASSSLVGIGIPIAFAHESQRRLLATQYDQNLSMEVQKAKDSLRKELRDLHGEYSLCMAEAYAFVRQHRGDPELSAALFLADVTQPKPSQQATRLNQCRSTCRRYWSRARLLTDMGVPSRELDEFASRHQRFTFVFRPMDKLDGYDERDMRVYDRL